MNKEVEGLSIIRTKLSKIPAIILVIILVTAFVSSYPTHACLERQIEQIEEKIESVEQNLKEAHENFEEISKKTRSS